ncbi:hypothetical protein SI65_01479 [Aspergillus cristatus]|uniref:Uncharacterized protein n=1 Tax=Aspergillus cristatus TaxID=573508 RepID=A0A1E3BSF7_ASPCR|nr:hypothetical protein SI65_01479 [Aspergillus cristatus]
MVPKKKKSKPAPSAAPPAAPPSLQSNSCKSVRKEKVDIIIYDTIEVDRNLDKDEIEAQARTAICNATFSLLTDMKGETKVVANVGGGLLTRLDYVEKELKAVKSNGEKYDAAFRALLDVRERAFLTWMRDSWRDHGAGSEAGPKTPAAALRNRILALNHSIFTEKRLHLEEEFAELYGLGPSEVETIATKRYNSILHILNAVGGFRFAGWYLKNQEKQVYHKVVGLVKEQKWDEAENAAKEFPFAPGFVELENVDGID